MNPSPPSTIEFAAFVALDWADQKHAWAFQVAGEARVQYGELENTPEAVQIWASELEQRFGGRPIAVALEQDRKSTRLNSSHIQKSRMPSSA